MSKFDPSLKHGDSVETFASLRPQSMPPCGATPHAEPPTIVLQGGDDGLDRPGTGDQIAPYFTALRHVATLVIGYNLPRGAPDVFAAAVQELGHIE